MEIILKEILTFLSDFPTYFSFIIPVFYLLRYKTNNKTYKYFTIYIVLMALVQLLMKLYVSFQVGDSNLFMFIYFMTFQFVFLSLFFYTILKHRIILILLVLVLCFLFVQYSMEPSLYFKYNPIGIVITQIILVTYSLIYFYKSLSIKGDFMIVNYGMFIYLLSSVLIFASGNLVFNKFIPLELSRNLSDLNAVLYFVFQLFIVFEWVKNYSGFFNKTTAK